LLLLVVIFFMLFPLGLSTILWQKTLLDQSVIKRLTRINHFVTIGGAAAAVISFAILAANGDVSWSPFVISNKQPIDTIPLFFLLLGALYAIVGAITYGFSALNTRISNRHPELVTAKGYGWLSLTALLNHSQPQNFWTIVQDVILCAAIVAFFATGLWFVGVYILAMLITKWWILRRIEASVPAPVQVPA